MSIFKKENIIDTINYYKELEEHDGNYYLLAHEIGDVIINMDNSKDKEVLFGIAKKWDGSNTINSIIGNLIESKINDDELLFGFYSVYNVCSDITKDEKLVDLFNYGYVVNHENKLKLSPDFIVLDDIVEAFMLIKSRYNGAKGFILFSFPKKYFSRKRNLLEESKYEFYKILKRNYIMYNTYFDGYISFLKDSCQYYERSLFKEKRK